MVFFRHLYYLRPPFIEGRPENSWLMDPVRVADPNALLTLLRRENIHWDTDYPEPLAPAFQALEDQGKLRPKFSADVSTFSGFRIYGRRVTVRVVILEVASAT